MNKNFVSFQLFLTSEQVTVLIFIRLVFSLFDKSEIVKFCSTFNITRAFQNGKNSGRHYLKTSDQKCGFKQTSNRAICSFENNDAIT